MFEDSVTYLYVMDVASGLTDDTEGPASLPAGAGAFFNFGTNVTEQTAITASANRFYFGYRSDDGILQRSPTFQGNQITNATKIDTVALTEQISYLGYNGTAGSMDDSDSTYFGLNHTFGLLNNSPLIKTIPFKTASSSSQTDLTFGLVQAGYKAFKNLPNADVKFEAVCNVAASATNDFTNIVTIVNGAKTFAVATNLTYNTAAGTLAVGDYIRFADDSLNGTLHVSDPVYKVTAINALVVTVDRPIDIPSGAWTDAGDGSQVIPAATAEAADWGIRMTGNTPDTVAEGFNPRTDTPFVVNFEVLSDDFETAEVTYATASAIGTGTYQLISSMEAYTQFQNKDRHVSAYPPHSVRIDAEATKGYDMYSFEIMDEVYASATTGINPRSKGRIVIAVEETLATDLGYFDDVLGV